jgi:hypothetical protein
MRGAPPPEQELRRLQENAASQAKSRVHAIFR